MTKKTNKSHKDYPKYLDELNELMKQWDDEFDELIKHSTERGKDGGSSVIHTKYVAKIKELQKNTIIYLIKHRAYA